MQYAIQYPGILDAVIVPDSTAGDDVPTAFVAEANALNILGVAASLSCIT